MTGVLAMAVNDVARGIVAGSYLGKLYFLRGPCKLVHARKIGSMSSQPAIVLAAEGSRPCMPHVTASMVLLLSRKRNPGVFSCVSPMMLPNVR